MFYLLFLATTLFARTDYYVIEAGDIFETYDTCYIALDYGEGVPEVRRLNCPRSFNFSQNYYRDSNKVVISWDFNKSVVRTREKSMGYGEFTVIEESYDLSDDDVCYLEVSTCNSSIVDDGIFGCGMTKLFVE